MRAGSKSFEHGRYDLKQRPSRANPWQQLSRHGARGVISAARERLSVLALLLFAARRPQRPEGHGVHRHAGPKPVINRDPPQRFRFPLASG